MIVKYRTLLRSLFIIFTIVYACLSIYLHSEVSKLFTGVYPNLTFGINIREKAIPISLFFAGLLFFYFFYKAVKGERRLITFLYWLLYSEIVFYYFKVFSLHPIEIVHFLQYGTITIFLGLCFDPQRNKFQFGKIIFWGSIIGITDEILQYYLINWVQGYMDFNDWWVNVLGSIGGALLLYGFKNENVILEALPKFYRTFRFYFSTILVLLIAILFALGYLGITPDHSLYPLTQAKINGKTITYLERISTYFDTLQKHFVHGYFYNLGPLSGMFLIISSIFIFSTFDIRFITSIKKILRFRKNDIH